jgi:3-carboxy-cis,cis-muconate cycloisomerase
MEALDDRHFIEAMLSFEAALARAQASAGLIPQAAALSIAGTCKVELFDVPKLVREAGRSRSLTAPLLGSLRETVGLFNPQAAEFVHFASSEPALADTAMVLLTRDALALIDRDLAQIIQRLLRLAEQPTGETRPGRKPAQAGTAVSLGRLCGPWAAALARTRQRLQQATADALSLQAGRGPAAASGQSSQVLVHMAGELGLRVGADGGPGQREDQMALGCALALLVASLAAYARELAPMDPAGIDQPSPARALYSLVQVAGQRVPQRLAALLGNLAQGQADDPGHGQASLAEWQALLMASHGAVSALLQALAGLPDNGARR